MIIGLIKNVKTKYNIHVQYLRYDNAVQNVDFEWAGKQEGMGMEFKYILPQVLPRRMALLNRNCDAVQLHTYDAQWWEAHQSSEKWLMGQIC